MQNGSIDGSRPGSLETEARALIKLYICGVILFVMLSVLSSLSGCAGTQRAARHLEPAPPGHVSMTQSAWKLSAKEGAFVMHLGRPSIRLRGGFAHLRDVNLNHGIIDFDMAANQGIAFSGVAFHVQDEGTFEKFYLRTFLSGSREACQYTPVFHHTAGWQIYHGQNFNRRLHFRADRWTHVRIVVSDGRADVYVADMNEPALHVDPLRLAAEGGGVALYNEPVPEGMRPVATYFSNVRVTVLDQPPTLRGTLRDPARRPAGSVPMFWVSEPFNGEALVDHAPDPRGLAWQPLAVETSGLANLARLSDVSIGSDTVFARLHVRAEHVRRARLRFGFSERVQVYVDGRRVFAADDTWHSRDITFQGVIGLYDEVSIDVAPEGTEVWFAVSENLIMRGGWAVQAAFVDPEGLSFETPRDLR